MKRIAATGIALLFGVALAGCGSDGSSANDPDAATTAQTPSTHSASPTPASPDLPGRDALRSAVQAYSDAYLTGDADKGFDLLSQRCQQRMGKGTFAATVAQAKKEFGDALPLKSFEAEINGKQARVTYTYSVAAINQTQEPWVVEDGSWHEDDC